ncbi:hypothetical protein [Sphingomonas lycopersici]|uniref:Uncharacterized protein n=1 Tax=Sphingomonas lycopersici TaxID=2951807 RepID=A0AA41ZDT6_9SPHN|nr:hypothetical protein [Sphingomonas lycopersici]MCW6537286.1 hypothetical protein [Sphingomonas lycopersici]
MPFVDGVMLDRYRFGDVDRISFEEPVPTMTGKLRINTHQQQLFGADFEELLRDPVPITQSDVFQALAAAYDVVAMPDYGRRALSDVEG